MASAKYADTETLGVVPESRSRQGEGEMGEQDLSSIVKRTLDSCQQFVEGELSSDRADATAYYKGGLFGNETPGRSQVVLTQVRDGIHAVLPSLVRVFHGPERTVEFVPTTPETTAAAEQATDYVQYVYTEDNAGFLTTLSLLKDGLIRKLGVVTWGWQKSNEVRTVDMKAVTRSELETLLQDDDCELLKGKEVKAEVPVPVDPQTQQPTGPGEEAEYDITVRYTDTEGRAWVAPVPLEKFWFSRDTTPGPEGLCVALADDKSRGELIALGIDEDDLDEHGGTDQRLDASPENTSRHAPAATPGSQPIEAGEANDLIRYVEAYLRVDFDGDGIAELRKICTIGPQFYVVKNEPWNEAPPFAVFCPILEPHTLVGMSWADQLMDIQKSQSMILRAVLDSLAASVFPRMAYVEGQVSVADIMNDAIGAPIRTRAPGMLQEYVTTFAGREAIPLLGMFDSIVERRTGRNNAAAGLKADALQSTSQGAVDAVVTASQEQAELMARVFAETLMKPMFRGLLRLLVANQPRERMVKLRNKWVPVDPRLWNANMQVKVNVALGVSFVEQKLQVLGVTLADQLHTLETQGLQNPFVTPAQIQHTRSRMLQLQGYPDAGEFWQDVPPDWQPPAPPQPPPTPEQVLAQAQVEVERMKIEKEYNVKQAELELKRLLAEQDHIIKIHQISVDAETKRLATNAQFHATTTAEQMRLDVEHDESAAYAELEAQQAAHAQKLAEDKQAHDQQLAAEQQAHDQQIAQQQADKPTTA